MEDFLDDESDLSDHELNDRLQGKDPIISSKGPMLKMQTQRENVTKRIAEVIDLSYVDYTNQEDNQGLDEKFNVTKNMSSLIQYQKKAIENRS